MSEGKIDVAAQPLVIVRRRRGSGDEPHHGGVWKIAYADFMTAMMAFFLVMWLVNAADKKTIVQVAAYFNPVRLTDKRPSSKGIEDPSNATRQIAGKRQKDSQEEAAKADEKPVIETRKNSSMEASDKAEKAPGTQSTTAGQAEKDEALFSDPMGVLDKLAKKAVIPELEGPKPGSANTALRDPFNPAHRIASDLGRQAPQMGDAAKPEFPKEVPRKDPKAKPKPLVATPSTDSKNGPDIEHQADAEKLDAEIRRALAPMGNTLPNVEIKLTPEGLLVSLTDGANFGMFSVGSAEPRPESVVVLAKIAGVLKTHEGQIVVRGHTDGRAYKGGNYDNWRLSAARAQMSYHMLVRGGVDPARVMAIEGHADRDLKLPEEKEAAQNRRIDILIKGGKT